MIFTIGSSTNVSPSVSGSGTTYTATYTVQSGQNGSVSFTISSYADSAGNNGGNVTATTNSSSVTVNNGLLDNRHSNLVAAYALRLLYANYLGNIIRVMHYTGNNWVDLKMDSDGNIVSMLNESGNEFGTSNSDFDSWTGGIPTKVMILYDQSLKGNNLTPSYQKPQFKKASYTSSYNTNISERYAIYFPGDNNYELKINSLTDFGTGNQSHTIITGYDYEIQNNGILFAIGHAGSNSNIAYHPKWSYHVYPHPLWFFYANDKSANQSIDAVNGVMDHGHNGGHMAFRYDSTATVGTRRNMRIHRNSTMRSLGLTGVGNHTQSLNLSTNKLIVGGAEDGGRTSYERYKGSLFHLLIYNSALSINNIQSISNKLISLS